MADDLGRI